MWTAARRSWWQCVIAIPPVDRGHGDARNIIGVITQRDKNYFYRVGIKQGLLWGRFSRNQFEVCQGKFVDLCDIDQSRMLSIREAVSMGSLGWGQGFIKCNCPGNRKKCDTNRCNCFENHLKCNSRCHNSLSCTNQWIKRTYNPVSVWILLSSASLLGCPNIVGKNAYF